jgi:hypothetical protein
MSQIPTGSMPPVNPAPPVKSGPGIGTIIAIIAAVGVAIILVCGGVLTMILLPALGKARTAAREIRDQVHARALVTSAMVYAADHQDALPPPDRWTEALADYLAVSGNTPAEIDVLDSSRIEGPTPDWIYRPLPARENAPGGRIADARFPADWVLFYEDVSRLPPTTETVIVAFLDGSARSISRAELESLLAQENGAGGSTPPASQGGASPKKSTGKN